MKYNDFLSTPIKRNNNGNAIIELRNKKKEIMGYTIIDDNLYYQLNQFKWHKDTNGYPISTINNKHWRISKYIFEILLKENIDNYQIDHINRNILNNKIENLRKVDHSGNMRNRGKKHNTSSEYIGVSYNKDKQIWTSVISINKKQLYAAYENEIHAAHQYNLWCHEYNLHTAQLNQINKEDINNFILYEKPIKKDNYLPKNILLTKNNRYNVKVKHKYIGTYDTLLEAVIARNLKFNQNII